MSSELRVDKIVPVDGVPTGGEWQGQITFSTSSYISMYMLG